MTAQAAYDMQYRSAMDSLGLAAQLLTPHSDIFAELIKAERDMHSSLHITNPTLYRDAINNKGLDMQVALAKAALAFILEVQKVKGQIPA